MSIKTTLSSCGLSARLKAAVVLTLFSSAGLWSTTLFATQSISPLQIPTDPVICLAIVLMSEASVGTTEERIAVAWTVFNRVASPRFPNTICAVAFSGAYATDQDPRNPDDTGTGQAIIKLARDLITNPPTDDPTRGATHFFSPLEMPKEGEESRCKPPIGSGIMDCGAGLHEVPGIAKRVYFPSWTRTMEWIGPLPNVRQAFYMFYRPQSTSSLPFLILTLQEAVARGFVQLESKGEFFGDGVTFIGTGRNTQDMIVNVRVGDVILSKDPAKQDLVITQGKEIFLPAGQSIRFEGLFIACLDSNKDPPRLGDKLDITLNLADWPFPSALELLRILQEQEGRVTQEAVWDVADRPDFPDPSNPNSLSPDTGVAFPSEISPEAFIAGYFDNCPSEVSAPNNVICRREMELATWHYLNDSPLPGTAGMKIDLKTLRRLTAFYMTRTPVGQPLPQSILRAAEARLEWFLGQQEAKRLEAKHALFTLKVSKGITGIEFQGAGVLVENIRVEIFDLSGQRIFDSGQVSGNSFTWHFKSVAGEPLSNGVYLYLVSVKSSTGTIRKSGKLVILR